MKNPPQVVLVTGAATGIGATTARLFLDRGWHVAATMRVPDRAGAWAQHPRCLVTRLDVTDDASAAEAVQHTARRFGRIDALVNNAGYGLNGPIEGMTPEQLRRQFDTNVLGLIGVIRHVLPHMRSRQSGVVINVSSIGGRIAFPFASAYHATKFAVEGLSESLRFELKAHGIRVKLVEPGGIKTDFITRSLEWAEHPAYEAHLAQMKAMTIRLNDNLPGPEGVAAVIFKAATDRSDRLRYPAKAGPYLAVNTLLPDHIWRRMIWKLLNRHARRAQRPAETA